MGNSLVFSDFEESTGPGSAVAFFQNVKLKWIKSFFGRVQENMLSGMDINDTHEMIKWREYFQLFSTIKEKMEAENDLIRKASWHSATLGYEMIRKEFEEEPDVVIVDEGVPDDHTDDDLSDDEEDDNDDPDNEDVNEGNPENLKEDLASADDPERSDKKSVKSDVKSETSARESGSKKSNSSAKSQSEISATSEASASGSQQLKRPFSWNPSLISPVFFGYTTLTTQQKMKNDDLEKDVLKIAEKRAIETAKSVRSNIIDSMEKTMNAQEASRAKKIADLESKYEIARQRREDDLTKNMSELSGMALRMFKDEWEHNYDAAEAAFDEEVGNLRQIHADKTRADRLAVRKKREDLEAFKDAEAQELPAAERLEEIARVEMGRWIDTADKKGKDLDKARVDYNQVRKELEDKQASSTGKTNAKAIMELRSMVNIAETTVREKQRDLEEVIDRLMDAEVLMNRAVRLRTQQDELLPLFSLLAGATESLPSECRLDYFAATMVIIINATFEQKMNFFLGMYDKSGDGFYDAKFLVAVVNLFQETLFRLNYLPSCSGLEEVRNTTMRQFFDLGLNSGVDALSTYETRQFLISLVSRISSIAKVFGFKEPGKDMGMYQRNRMSPVALLTRGMVGPTVCKYRVHYEMLKFKPQLHPQQMQIIHERSMTMGVDDPLKPDYTKFLTKPKKKKKSNIEPLYHGYLSNPEFLDTRTRIEAVVLIQSVYRSYRERRVAELAARKQAFLEAKEVAMKEMRDKVVREFRKREASGGVGKMKWDAQVRMRQAKARVAGQSISRGDMVLVMMEETINKARDEIEAKFQKIEEKEAFKGVTFEKKEIKLEDEIANLDIGAMFGMVFKSTVQDQDIMADSISTPRGDDEEVKDENEHRGTAGGGGGSGESQDFALSIVSRDRTQKMIEGTYVLDLTAKGETAMEWELRQTMVGPEPVSSHFMSRLRAMNDAMTLLKTSGILAEIPSKRLLLKYVEFNSFSFIVEELASHFRFTRNITAIAKLFQNLVYSDLERGIMMRDLRATQNYVDAVLRNMVAADLKYFVAELDETVQRRVETNENAREGQLIEAELERLDGNVQRFQTAMEGVLENMDLIKERFRRARMSHAEAERKRKCVLKLQEIKMGQLMEVEIIVEDRQNWMKRFITASRLQLKPTNPDDEQFKLKLRRGQITASKLDIPFTTEAMATVNKFSEIRNVGREFLETARGDALIIISEHFHPKYRKTIPVVTEQTVHGRFRECGRGFGGKYYTYEAHNNVYTVSEDSNGVYNGSDEYAAKVAGKDRLASLEYFKAHVEHLNVPLTATIDYGGFRVLAVAKLPVEKVMYADDGEVRKISEEMVHGVQKDGDTFINKGKVGQNMLKAAANKLNLAEHSIKGFKDIASSITYGACDLKLYRGPFEEYYIKDFARAFPPEIASETPYFAPVPRDQSVFWRFLRPEFLRSFPKPLSPDACSAVVQDLPDRRMHYDNLVEASSLLVGKVIPELAETLVARDYFIPLSEGMGVDLSKDLHARGINMRHLGYIRSLLWRPIPGTVNIYFHEQFIRTSRDLRDEVQLGDFIEVEGKRYLVQEGSTSNLKLAARTVPLGEKYFGTSRNRIIATFGRVSSAKNSASLRSVIFAEMVARTMKCLIRLHQRNYMRKEKAVSSPIAAALTCEYFNVITGASKQSVRMLEETIYDGMRERFGKYAVTPSERPVLQSILEPCIIYTIKRLQTMVGVQLTVACIAEFSERPVGFEFSPQDIMEITPIVRHNIPLLAYSEAVLVTEKAKEMEKETYKEQVALDKPVIYLRLTERKGARTAENYHGTLIDAFQSAFEMDDKTGKGGGESGLKAFEDASRRIAAHGAYTYSCDLEHPGPIGNDPFSRSVRFNVGVKAHIDTRFHPMAVPQGWHDHFSAEVFAKVLGGEDSTRTVLMNGRYAILASRENYWTVMMMQNMYEIYVRVAPVVVGEWAHLVCTYDGTTLRCYFNSVLRASVETEVPFKLRMDEFDREIAEKKAVLKKAEDLERSTIKDKTTEFSEQFFITKEGVYAMKKSSQAIMETDAFQSEEYGSDAKDEATAIKIRRQEALKQAKTKYATDLYIKNVQEVAGRYKLLMDELNDTVNKQKEDGVVRTRKGLRIGASVSSGGSKDGNNFFVGDISNVSVYNRCLSADRTRAHYFTATYDKTKDAQRLYSEASARYEEALYFAPDDEFIMNGYAKSLCEYLKVEVTGATAPGVSRGKLKTMAAIDKFTEWNIPQGIAEIVMALPQDVEFADIVCHGYRCMRKIDPGFFMRDYPTMNRSHLVTLPRLFSLDEPTNPQEVLQVAAWMYQETSKDTKLRFSYGELDLGWLRELHSPELVVSLVRYASEVGNLKKVVVGEIFKAAGHESISLSDHDVGVMAQNLLTSIAFDLSGCTTMTNIAMEDISRLQDLRALCLDDCSLITDQGIMKLKSLAERLEVFSLAGLTQITNHGLLQMAKECRSLVTLNVSNCKNITFELLYLFAKNNSRLATLRAAATHITDDGMSKLSTVLSKKHLTSLDISFCRDIADYGLTSLAESCPNIKYLNLSGLSRITDEGARHICAKCWYLVDLNMEDLFLLNDDAFWFSSIFDGRPAADENMLKSLVNLSLRDCVNVTNQALRGLAERCRKIERLVLRGCDKLTDAVVPLILDPYADPFQVPMVDSIRILDVGYCLHLSINAMRQLLPACGVLEEVDMSGMTAINDSFIHELCHACPTIQRLRIQKCVLITDAALCTLADYMWIEELDISSCKKITDEGLEVLAVACNGLQKLVLHKVSKVTGRTMASLARNCKAVREVDIRGCPLVTKPAVDDFLRKHRTAKVITEVAAKKASVLTKGPAAAAAAGDDGGGGDGATGVTFTTAQSQRAGSVSGGGHSGR